MFIEYIFKKGYIDTVVGTDALALGVNFPAKYTILAQTYKNKSNALEPSEFLQLLGRAGRYGFHDIGYASWLIDSPVEFKNIDTENNFKMLLNSNLEQVKIETEIDFKSLFNGRFVEEEIDYLMKYYYPKREKEVGMFNKYKDLVLEAELDIDNYKKLIQNSYTKQEYIIWFDLISKYYLPEWDLKTNFDVSRICLDSLICNGDINCNLICDLLTDDSMYLGEILHHYLLIIKWAKKFIDKDYLLVHYNELYDKINNIDHTIYNDTNL